MRKSRETAATGRGQRVARLGYIAFARGDVGSAGARFVDGTHAYQRIQDREGLTYTLDGLAAIAFAEGKPELAATALGAADATRGLVGVGVYPLVEQTFRAPLVSAVRAALGEAAFGVSWAAGSATGLNEAIEELLALAR